MVRRGRVPAKYMEILRLLEPCQGYDKGKTIDELSDKLYGKHNPESKQKTRLLIIAARIAMRRLGINVDIASIKIYGQTEKRYCYLTTVAEYAKAIGDFEAHVEGTEKTKEEFEKRRETVEARRKLEEARRAKAKKTEEAKAEEAESANNTA